MGYSPFREFVNHYLAAHPAYLVEGNTYDRAVYGQFRRPDYLDRILNYHAEDTKQGLYEGTICKYIVPGTSTYYSPGWIDAGDDYSVGSPSIFFVPAKSLNPNINPKDYVTVVCKGHGPISSILRYRCGNPGNIWIRQIFRGDWQDNFDVQDNTWTLKDPGNILHLKTELDAVHGAHGGFQFFLTNPLLTGKNRVWYSPSGGAYAIRYITSEEAVEIHNATATSTLSSKLSSGEYPNIVYGSRLDLAGGLNGVHVTEHNMTNSDFVALLSERWVITDNSTSASVKLQNKIFNRSVAWATKNGIIVDDNYVATLSGDDVIRQSILDEFTKHTYGKAWSEMNEIERASLIDPIDNQPYYICNTDNSDGNDTFDQVTDVSTGWSTTYSNFWLVSGERGLDNPPSGFGECDFVNNAIKKVPSSEVGPDDLANPSTLSDEEGYSYKLVTNGTGDIKTAAGTTMAAGGTPANEKTDEDDGTTYGTNNLRVLQQVKWFRARSYYSQPANVAGIWSKAEKIELPLPPNCLTKPSVFSPAYIK